jgi:redox-sensing transcriptional repressor
VRQPVILQSPRPVERRPSRGRLPQKVVARLALYRRILAGAAREGRNFLFSHELASLSGASPAQVRRDLMSVGHLGHPLHGYEIAGLREKIDQLLGTPAEATLVLVGIGNLGRALLAYFAGSSGESRFVAAFDTAPEKVDRTISGCHCYSAERLVEIVRRMRPEVGVIAVPPTEAQAVAGQLVTAGVRSLINLAAVPLQVPPHVFVEELDISILVERAVFFARSQWKEV